MKRMISIQDISCLGKCSLTVALPIVSAFGIECSVMPTAVLSTHTMFKGFTFRDLTDDMDPIAEHWQREKIRFDAIYTGYLGSFRQLDLVSSFIDKFGTESNTVFIDPVMADNGKLYPGFTPEFAAAMGKLCGKADVIVPNLTEASFMLGIPWKGEGYTEAEIKDQLKRLCGLGAKVSILTGVKFRAGEIGVMGYDSAKDEFFSYFHKHIPVSFHGTGDIFSSACISAITRGFSMHDSLKLAADFTVESIALTMENPEHVTYGVEFERAIPSLIQNFQKIKS